jgi:hypothetical protein
MKEPTNFKRMTPDQNFNAMSEIREYMYTLIDSVHKDYRENRKVVTYYEKYTNYN